MKKWLVSILVLLTMLSTTVALVACGENEPPQPPDATKYTIEYEESPYYDYGWHSTTLTAGEIAYVEVESSHDAAVIEKVLYNGKECTKSTTEANRYEYTMPAENVYITVVLKWTDNESHEFLSWHADNNYTLEVSTDPDYKVDMDWEHNSEGVVYFNRLNALVHNKPYFQNYETKVVSLNTDIIPNEALQVLPVTNDNSAVGFEIRVDRSKIKAGKAQIMLSVEGTSAWQDIATLICTITVTE